MDEEIYTTLKILLIGESGVGKSSLLLRFTNDGFDPTQPLTIGSDVSTKEIYLDGHLVKLAIWDTAGQERFRAITPSYYRNAHGAILVYDVTNKETYHKIQNWFTEMDLYTEKLDVVKMIVGNKIDLDERQVTREEGMNLARKYSTLFVETSAKTSENVEYAFEELVQKIIQTPVLWKSNKNNGIQLSETTSHSSWYDCNGWKCRVI